MSMPRLRRHPRHHDSHGDRQPDRTSERNRQRSPARDVSPSRHSARPHPASKGKTASALCVIAAGLTFGTTLIAELIAYMREEPTNLLLGGFAGLLALAALAAGGYAQVVQLRYWSRRVRNRLLVGLPVAALTLSVNAVNFYTRQMPKQPPPTPPAAGQPSEPDDVDFRDLFASGWYGEGQENGVMVSLASFAESTAAAQRFNRLVPRPMSYAALTVINLSSPLPVVLQSVRVGLLLDSGEEVQSLDVKPLLNADEHMKRRLSEPQTLAAGAMAPDIPICLEAGFPWERVRGVKVTFEDRALFIPGRMLATEEKNALLEKPGAAKAPAAAATNLTGEAWFKDL